MRIDEPQFRRDLDRLTPLLDQAEAGNPAELRRALENLRVGAIYLLFDLEATRRDVRHLESLLEALDPEADRDTL